MKKQSWLADGKKVDKYGTVWEVKLLDGPHDDPIGVKEAEQIITRIGLDKGLNRNYVMVTVEDVPDVKVTLNEEAISLNKKAVDTFNETRT